MLRVVDVLNARGRIIPTPNQIIVKGANNRPICCYEYDASSVDEPTLLEQIKRIARKHFITGRLMERNNVCLPCERFDMFGWSRARRPIGQVSVETIEYAIF